MKKILIIFIIFLIVAGGWTLYHFKIKHQGLTQTIVGSDYFGFAGLYGSKDYQLAKISGAGWIRPEINWQTIEPKNDEFNWDGLDKIYNDYHQKYGFKVMVSLRTGDLDWATKADLSLCQLKSDAKTKGCPDKYASLPPNDLGETWNNQYGYSKNYYDFVYKTVEHFKGRVDYFIIENEVNTLTFWHGTADEYLKLRATAYKAAHDANPNVIIIDNGLASLAWINTIIREKYCAGDKASATDFFRLAYSRTLSADELEQAIAQTPIDCQNPERQYQIVKAVLKEPTFDIASYHFYEPWQIQKNVIEWLKTEMQKNGYQKPIICSEGGYFDKIHQQDDKANQKIVAQDIIKLHVIAYGEGIQKFIWYPLIEKNTSLSYKGLFNSKYKKIPAANAFEMIIRKIGQFSQVEKLNLGANIFGYKFIVSEKPVYVLWSNNQQTLNFTNQFSGFVQTTNIDGSVKSQNSSAISIGESPIFVESQ